MARLTKAQSEVMEQFGFVVEEAPQRTNTRQSKYDPMWLAAKSLLESMPGTTMKVRTYTTASAAYADAKQINNSEHRIFTDGNLWTAVATKTDEIDEEGNPLYGIWLTYNGE